MTETQFLQDLLKLVSPLRLAEALVVITLAWVVIRLLKLLLMHSEKRFNRYRLVFSRLFPLLRLGVWIVALVFIIFGIFRPPQNAVLALFASLGIAIGLAAQDVLKNWMAGLFMLFNRPYQLGDMVHVAGYYGEIIGIDMSSTRLRTFDDSVVIIPNGEIFKQAVANSNSGELTELVAIEFDLPASVNITRVREIAWEAAVTSPYSYLKKPVTVVVSDRFDRTFLTHFKIKVYVVDVRLEPLIASDITERIKYEMVRLGIISEQRVFGMLQNEG